jgi:V/A-type H+-transporting ATPase subunit D
MTILKLAPTRSNLLRLKTSLQFAKEGYSILDKKREALTIEIMSLVEKAEQQQEHVQSLMQTAYQTIELARLTMGEKQVSWAALSVPESVEVSIVNYGMMGVPLPRVKKIGTAQELTYGLGATTVALDAAARYFRQIAEEIPLTTTYQISIRRLARELKKTRRRVNALSKIFIPDYEETIQFIEETLEEQDREEIFRLQWLQKAKEQ